MFDYETLDKIADSYIPVLAVLLLSIIARNAISGQRRITAIQLASLCLGLLLAYGLMFADNHFEIWPALALDYSTHTAVALALLFSLSVSLKIYIPFWIASFVAYVLLMLYQQYHSLADIITTALAISLILIPANLLLYHKLPPTNKA